MKVYEGRRTDDGCVVTAGGRPLDLRLDLRMHADRPEWGYAGSGPAQLALALLADAAGEAVALCRYQCFKRSIVAQFDRAGWILTQGEIRSWIHALLTADKPPNGGPSPVA